MASLFDIQAYHTSICAYPEVRVAHPPSSAANWMYSFEVAHKAYFSAASEFLAALDMANARDQSQCEPLGVAGAVYQ
jgi:hypothetical protein